MRKLTAAIGALVLAVVPGIVSAKPLPPTTTIIGTPATPSTTPGIYFQYNPNVNGVFGNSDPTSAAGMFSNAFIFTTGFDRVATIDITSFMANAGKSFADDVNFVSNGVKINGTVIPATRKGSFEERYLANFRIPAGTQRILVNGSSGPTGTFSGLLTLSGVPEPSTWSLMILGFGFTGAAMRRRVRTKRVAFT